MKKENDIFTLIKKDHRKVESLFSKIERTTERAAKTREMLYSELRQEITYHSDAEEQVLYPFLKREESTCEIAFESVEEHAVVKFLLDKLDNTDTATPEWTAQMATLKEVIQHHVEEEEKEMFAKMRKAFPADVLHSLGFEFQIAKPAPLREVA